MASLRERLAALEHEQWMAWSQNIATSEAFIDSERLRRWATLWVPYDDLTEEQKDQDREWADKVLDEVDRHAPDVRDMACACGPDMTSQRTSEREWVSDWLAKKGYSTDNLITTIVIHLSAAYGAEVRHIANDPGGWSGILTVAEGTGVADEWRTWVECDRIEDGFVLTAKRWVEKFGDGNNWRVDDDDEDS